MAGRMTAIGWQGRLNEASTMDEVGRVVAAFLLPWTPALLAELPASCRPPEGLEVADISPYALKLIRQLGVGERDSAPRLHEITVFFTKAALRLAQISTQAAVVAHEERSQSPD